MEIQDVIFNKAMLFNSHPVVDLLKEYREKWFQDYQETKGCLPYEYFFVNKHIKAVSQSGNIIEEEGNEDLWGKRALRFYESLNNESIDSYDQK